MRDVRDKIFGQKIRNIRNSRNLPFEINVLGGYGCGYGCAKVTDVAGYFTRVTVMMPALPEGQSVRGLKSGSSYVRLTENFFPVFLP